MFYAGASFAVVAVWGGAVAVAMCFWAYAVVSYLASMRELPAFLLVTLLLFCRWYRSLIAGSLVFAQPTSHRSGAMRAG